MKWTRFWLETFLGVLAIALEGPKWTKESAVAGAVNGVGWTTQKKLAARCAIRFRTRCSSSDILSRIARKLESYGIMDLTTT
jgi:hypothetical protein